MCTVCWLILIVATKWCFCLSVSMSGGRTSVAAVIEVIGRRNRWSASEMSYNIVSTLSMIHHWTSRHSFTTNCNVSVPDMANSQSCPYLVL